MRLQFVNGVHQAAPGDLSLASTAIQALDNQWVPKSILKDLISKGTPRETEEKEINRLAREEYIRALINARHVVVNRAYIFNSAVIQYDLLKSHKTWSDMQKLVAKAAIVPFLSIEKSPADTPSGFDLNESAIGRWQELVKNTNVTCARLSWDDIEGDDKENLSLIRSRLARPFHDFARTIDSLEDEGLARSVLPPERKDESHLLRRRLRDVAEATFDVPDNRFVARQQLYQTFICQDDQPNSVIRGCYDKEKPFAAEIKSLLDLRYNTNLPDALGISALTAGDSPGRAALQEGRENPGGNVIDSNALIAALQFDILQRDLSALWTFPWDRLTLGGVLAVRETCEWHYYMESLEQLLESPLSFGNPQDGIPKVYANYKKLSKQIHNQILLDAGSKPDGLVGVAEDAIEIVFDVAFGPVLRIVFLAGKIFGIVDDNWLAKLDNRRRRIVGRFLIGAKGASAPAVSQEFLKGRIDNTVDTINDIVARLREKGIEIVKQSEITQSRERNDEVAEPPTSTLGEPEE